MTDRYLTPEELAAALRLRPSTVKTWAREGIIPCIRFSQRVVRFDMEAVREAIAARSLREHELRREEGEHAPR